MSVRALSTIAHTRPASDIRDFIGKGALIKIGARHNQTETIPNPSEVRFGPLADIPPIHSMTSSALASSEAGIVTPNAFRRFEIDDQCRAGRFDGNGLRQQLAIGQQQKQRVPAQTKFSTHPLCFHFSSTDA
jgi:hypothetical protein